MLAVPSAAQAQDTGTYSSAPLDWGQGPGTAWVDYNGDRKADFCRITAAGQLQCTLATGRGFGATVSAPAVDIGYPDQRMWGDVDGNGGADYCRRVDSSTNQGYQCSLASPDGFTIQPVPERLLWGDVAGSALVDATGDGKADFCRVTTDQAICSPFTANGFGPGFATAVDPGPAEGRAWVDVNADGKADFCRVLSVLSCTLSSGSGFGGTLSSGPLDLGYPPGRSWADIDGDGRADYCREVGNGGADQRMSCTLATASGFGANYVSQPLEWGTDHGWRDFNGDGFKDFCRTVGVAPSTQLFCTLWTPAGFGETIASGPIDVGYAGGRAWVDHNGDGKIDFCRLTGNADDQRVTCTTSNGTAFDAVPEAGPPPPPPPPAPPVKKTRLVVTLSWSHKLYRSGTTRFTRLQVKGVPAGAKVKVTCKKGCTRKAYTVNKKARGTVSLIKLVRNKRLKSGATIRVVVSRPGNLAAIKTLKTRKRKDPTVKTG
jgi:hypothetical protein